MHRSRKGERGQSRQLQRRNLLAALRRRLRGLLAARLRDFAPFVCVFPREVLAQGMRTNVLRAVLILIGLFKKIVVADNERAGADDG